MMMAKIFKPIRWPHSADPTPAAAPTDRSVAAAGEGRVETQPVTNTSPSGPSPGIDAGYGADEDAWMALLELVFEETGWPDAE